MSREMRHLSFDRAWAVRLLDRTAIGLVLLLVVVAAREFRVHASWAGLLTVAALVVGVAAGSVLDVRMPSGALLSPVGSATAFGIALTPWRLREVIDAPGWATIVLITALGAGIAAVVRHRLLGVRPVPLRLLGLVSGVLVASWLYRVLPVSSGRPAMQMWPIWADERWRSLLMMLLAASAGAVVELLCIAGSLWVGRSMEMVRTQLRWLVPLQGAVMCTAMAVGAGMEPLGLLSLPLMVAPLLLVRTALERDHRRRLEQGRAIAELAQAPERTGYVAHGHAQRVLALCHRVGRQMHLDEADLIRLDIAAQLHDIGQIGMPRPLPRGATVEAAPVDQHDLAMEAATLVETMELQESVVQVVAQQAVPYRQVREFGEDVPLTSRIIMVCNAYDDFTAGDPQAHSAAVERLSLGLGYEYDPEVVEAVRQCVGQDVGSIRTGGLVD